MFYKTSKIVYLIFLFYLGIFSNLFYVVPGATIVLGFGMIVLLIFDKFNRRDLITVVVPKPITYFILFSLYCLLSGIFIASDSLHLTSSIFTYIQMIALMFYIINASAIEKSNVFFVKSFIYFAVIYMVILLIWGYTRIDGRLTLAFGENPNNDARVLLYGMACALIYINQKKLSGFLLTFGLSGMFTYTIIMTGSRKSFFAAILLFMMWIIFAYKDFWKMYSAKQKFTFILTFLGIISVLVKSFAPMFFESSLYQRLITKGVSISDDMERTAMYDEAFKFLEDNILFGIGFDHFRLLSSFGTYSHSTYAELISDTGLLGSLIYLTAYIVIAYNLIHLLLKSKGTIIFTRTVSYLILFLIFLILGTGVIHFYGIIDNIMIALLISFYYTEKKNLQTTKC